MTQSAFDFDAASGMSLAEAQRIVRDKRAEGVECPCCEQYCKVYKRRLNGAMAQWLIWLVREHETGGGEAWLHVNDGPVIQSRKGGGDFAKLAHWGLIQERPNDEDEAKRASGYWRPTTSGVDFAHGRITVSAYVFIWNNNVVEFSEEHATIQQALGARFNYRELMGWPGISEEPPA